MKIVVLGSCRFEPYEFLAVPNRIPGALNTEKGYRRASEKFYPAMKKADVVWIYAPDGIGEHTQKDIDEAQRLGKKIMILVPFIAKSIHRKEGKLNGGS